MASEIIPQPKKTSFKLINEILLALNNQLTDGRIVCDLEKAFDSINHDILLSKYEFYGFRSKTNALLCSYFSDRCHRLLINNSFSNNTSFEKKTWCSSSFNTWSFVLLINLHKLSSEHNTSWPIETNFIFRWPSIIITNPSPSIM